MANPVPGLLRTQGDVDGEGLGNQAPPRTRSLLPVPTGDGQFQSPLRWEVVGKNLLAMAVQGPLFLLFTLLLQHRARLLPLSVGIRAGWQGPGASFRPTHVSILRPKLKLLPSLGEEDEDVARERERMVRGATQGDVLVLRDLTKVGGWRWVGGFRWPTHLSQGPVFLPGVPRAEDTSRGPPVPGDPPWRGESRSVLVQGSPVRGRPTVCPYPILITFCVPSAFY